MYSILKLISYETDCGKWFYKNWMGTGWRQPLDTACFYRGIESFFQTRREISRSVRLGLPDIFSKEIGTSILLWSRMYFLWKKNILGASLVAQFKTPIQVESDLLAAARGLFKCEAGIACILGTGSNSCFYDGKIVVKNVKAGGYILGDEGSGAVLGKMFLSDVLKGLAPKDVMADFLKNFVSALMK